MPPNRFESEVESFLEGSHGDRTHIKRADHPRLHHYAGRYSGHLVLTREKVRPARPLHRHFREKTRPARHKPPVLGLFSCAGRTFSRSRPRSGHAGRTFSRTRHGDVARKQPPLPLQSLVQASMKPPSPLRTPEQQPLKPTTPWPGLVLWTGCFEGCWLLLVVLCPLARVLVG